MMGRKLHVRKVLLSCVVGLLAAVSLLGSQPSADAAWDGNQAVQLGDQITAEFRAAPLTEVHKYQFFAP